MLQKKNEYFYKYTLKLAISHQSLKKEKIIMRLSLD